MTTRSLSSPWALVRAQTAPSSSNVSSRATASGISASTSLSRAQVSKWMRKRSSVALDPLEHRRHGIAGECRELGDVLAAVAVLGRLLPAPDRLDRRVEPLHLRPGVVVVVLALDLVAGEREQPGHGVAVGAVPGVRDGDRAGRVGRDHLHLDPLAAPRPTPPPNPSPAARISPIAVGEPRVRDAEIDEARPGRLRRLDEALRGCLRARSRRRCRAGAACAAGASRSATFVA